MKLPLIAILIASILLVSAASLTPPANSAEATAQAAHKNKTEVLASTLPVPPENAAGSVASVASLNKDYGLFVQASWV
jgi:hypothetical protein